MQEISQYLSIAAFVILIISWFVFLGLFAFRRRPATAPDSKRAPRSFAGLAVQAIGFGVVWGFQREPFLSPLFEGQFALNIILQVLAVFLMTSSVWLTMFAVRELGKQFALQARLIEGHELITSGVYRIVRHPIYTAMFGMLLATAFVMSHWIALIVGVCLFLIGTRIRTASEDRLLSDAFGAEFAAWKKKVPGLVPFAKW